MFKNLTPHPLKIRKEDGTVLELQPYAEKPLRAEEIIDAQTQFRGISVKKKTYTTTNEEVDKVLEMMQLCDEETGDLYTCFIIVSAIMAQALKNKGITHNIFIPGTLDKATGICDGLCII